MNRLNKIIEFLIYLFIFLLPISTVWILKEQFIFGFKWQEGSFLIYSIEIIFWLIIINYMYYILKQKKELIFDRFKLLVFIVIGLVMFYSILSVAWSTNNYLSIYWWLKLIEGIVLMFIVLNSQIKIKFILRSLLLAGLLQSILGLWQFLSQQVVASKWLGVASHLPLDINSSVVGALDQRWLRAYGTLPHPNIFGGFLVICFLAGVYLYINESTNKRKLLVSISLVFITVGLFFSFSRSAWLAAVIAYFTCLMILIYKKRFLDLIKISTYLLLILVPLLVIYKPLILTRLSNTERLEEKSIEQRVDSLFEAKDVFLTQPILGVGLGNYTNYLVTFRPGSPGWHYQPAHNIYLMILAELGIIGFGLFILLILLAGYKASNMFTVSALLALLIVGFFDHYLWTSYFGVMLFWLIIGLSLKDFSKVGFLEKIISKVLLEVSYFSGRDLYKPDYISLVTTFRCNFKCKTCDIWKKTNFDGEMNIDEWLGVAKQLKSYLPAKSFVEISGGEALIKKDLVFSLIGDLKKYFQTVVLNTNGSLINEKTIQELENQKLDRLKVSLYSLEADSHNFVRGTEIAFKNAMRTVDLVVKSSIKLEVGVLITSYNVKQIPALVDYLYDLGNVDVIIQPLDEIIESNQSKNMINNEMVVNLWPGIEKSKELFDWLKNNSNKLKNSLANIIAIEDYYLDPKRVLRYRCFAGQRNMVIYPTGDIALCFKRRFIGNLRKEKLKKIMKVNALLERKGIRGCGKYCRIVGCNFSRGVLEVIKR
ncbi:radical SAM protein [Candidatus Falkowbacteria bacterium]|uniref:Radical SAM core domain-containing protein n=1 Tax=Candidatus Buchananbacteria bacterium CG10_big_fil_rev_8_21_14_0_10_33_19 TaxID=1974525 RepID=A0A2H0W564_9BACT|nr:radical SAM protein [Candidatus Falkowbacteria bacterium]PIS06417.1 MAG: hypothetical protein COT80_00540 [Candidatus Buchananbacteria bacterium CG10_big_fil_rev_8_21_14_0_10_33_19]